MVSLRILSGKRAGVTVQLARFPSAIGRASDCQVILDEPGIWDRHLQLDLDVHDGFILSVLRPEAIATVNGNPFQRGSLRNGDLIQAASNKLQFFLTPPVQRDFRLREAATWLGFCLLAAAQAYIVYWLLH